MRDSTPWFLEKEEDKILMLTLALNNKRERKWVYEINLTRPKFGEYHQSMQELEDDEEKMKTILQII